MSGYEYGLFKDAGGNYSVIEVYSDEYCEKGLYLQLIAAGSKEKMELEMRDSIMWDKCKKDEGCE